MHERANGQGPSDPVQTPPTLPYPTDAVVLMMGNALESAIAEFYALMPCLDAVTAERHMTIRRRIIFAQAAATALQLGSRHGVEQLLKLQADADAVEGQVTA